MMFRRVFLIALFLAVLPAAAQQDGPVRYISDDGALQFDYLPDWTIETQRVTFNQLYEYDLWTNSSALVPFLGNADRCRILLDVVNPQASGYPTNLVQPADFADYVLAGNYGEAAEITLGGYPAIRAVPDAALMPAPDPITVSKNFGPPVLVTPLGADDGSHVGVFYAVVRDDGWVVLANMAAPPADLESADEAVVRLLESLTLDAETAATPVERVLPLYDVSDVDLTRTFTSEDRIFSLHYPAGWGTPEFNVIGDPVVMYAAEFDGSPQYNAVRLIVMDVTSGGMGFPLDLNEPAEFIRAARSANPIAIGPGSLIRQAEFRVGDLDAVQVITAEADFRRSTIAVPLNDYWVAAVVVEADDVEALSGVEAEAVAVLASLRFGLGESIILSNALHVDLPDEWVVGVSIQEAQYNAFLLRPAGPLDPDSPRIRIELANINDMPLIFSARLLGSQTLLDTVVAADGSEMTEAPHLQDIGGYEVWRVSGQNPSSGLFAEYSVMLHSTWVCAMTGYSRTEEEARDLLPYIDRIIQQAEFNTLPREILSAADDSE